MNTSAKLTAYGAALVLVAGGAWALGTAVGPFDAEAVPRPAESGTHAEAGAHGSEDAGHGDDHGGTVAGTAQADPPGGLASSRGGYTLTPTETTFSPGPDRPFSFRINGPDGMPVTGYDVEHEKLLHLIVVRRDTAAFQHVHPELAPDGTWTVPLNLTDPGSYRVFTDFKPAGGEALTLGTDLAVPGDFRPVAHPESREASVDGYRVWLDGTLRAGGTSELNLAVAKDGRPVTDLQPYLGAYGHLVSLRSGDLAYLHVHPDGAPGDGRTTPGPTIKFFAEVPTAGTYRMFLDFQHEGVVRTAEFTVTTEESAKDPEASTPHSHGEPVAGEGVPR